MLIKDLYTLTSFENNDGAVTAQIHLNKDNNIFKGHFPGNPVMPGVCMIQIIKELTEKATESSLFLSQTSNIKFMAIINPNITPDLNLNISITETEDGFKIKNDSSFGDTLALKMSALFTKI
ncbi:3-hydroxyacyl-ACP dehydratase [Patiriisocius marinistellae]|uniref:3-hydroxyacyl-ACP dehydratase n=1 Tax=Patiriisocius marinistellae TaxID=2494560 RepID=A0A5J4FZT1_9FLAO|nr:3-hydroxyacyl-ACP dehydratase [Patiriisocius marinistellae]GEQ85241.1 3-hydroxyacyl-ACP dehydratase [Patiriisocius marinistellae]